MIPPAFSPEYVPASVPQGPSYLPVCGRRRKAPGHTVLRSTAVPGTVRKAPGPPG